MDVKVRIANHRFIVRLQTSNIPKFFLKGFHPKKLK